MKTIRVLLIFAVAILGAVGTVEAQRTRRNTPRKPAVKPTPKPTPIPMEVRQARETVANQRANVNLFVDKVAPIAVSIETLDREAKAKRLRKEVVDGNEANKKKLLESFRNMRVGLVNLENEFRSKPSLRKYLPQLEGIAALSTQAEDSALAGRFVDARTPLVTVSTKLSDTLASMPASPGAATATPLRASSTAAPARTSNVSSSGANTALRIGMTQPEAVASWGEPLNKRRTQSGSRITEVWTYSNNRTLYFVNGKLTNILQ